MSLESVDFPMDCANGQIHYSPKDPGYSSVYKVAASMSYQLIKSDSTVCPVKVPQADGTSQAVEAPRQKLSKEQLVNKLNYLNFQDEPILINFKHKKYGQEYTCPAKPQPCLGEEVICTWVDPSAIKAKLE